MIGVRAKAMERLLVVRCPDLEVDDEGGRAFRAFADVTAAVGNYCPWTTTVRVGVCSLPARGPARYFGGEAALVAAVSAAVSAAIPTRSAPQVGIADGQFAALIAAREGLVVPAGGTASFLAPLPVADLVDPSLVGLLARLGIRTIGAFAALPPEHVAGRFGTEGMVAHRVARGESGDPGTPVPRRAGPRRAGPRRAAPGGGAAQPPASPRPPDRIHQDGFWGGVRDADLRAARCLAGLQRLVGPEGVGTLRIQGARTPLGQTRFVTWDGRTTPGRDPAGLVPEGAGRGPWPGRIPPPAPMLVHLVPRPAELLSADGAPVTVSGRGLLSARPDRLSLEGGRWAEVSAWSGPWPCEERWWSRAQRRGAHLQVVTGDACRLLVAERGRWWVEATYG